MSAIEAGSVPPPGWTEQTVSGGDAPAPAVTAGPVHSTTAGQPATEAAVRWRVRAATLDNLLVYSGYVLLCLVLHWRVATLSHWFVLLVLGVVYHLVLESRDGQTIGKRRYGLQVVSVDGSPAGPKAIAMRSVLRLIDSLPICYLSGLISMVRTGPERRQRIGDVAGETKVVAIGGQAAARGTPGWMLPTATLLALAISLLGTYETVTAGSRPLNSQQTAGFIAGCERSAGALIDCQCFLSHLEADGYNSTDSLRGLVQDAQSERLARQSGPARYEFDSSARACPR